MLRYYLPTDALENVQTLHKDGRELDSTIYDKVCIHIFEVLKEYVVDATK